VETIISSAEAQDEHGITSKHGRMPSGELRFRLLSADGTAYIRTEAQPGGGWQTAHSHEKVLETYIVQNGWVAYAEFIKNNLTINRFYPGECFTTRPHVIHNVYMPADAVIHTVKHGNGIGEIRKEDLQFTLMTHAVSEGDIISIASGGGSRSTFDSQEYNNDYRHFDNLIWQCSAWASALFTLGLAGLTQISQGNPLSSIIRGFGYIPMLATFSAMFGVFILVISHALYRFRWHQNCKRWLSPQFGLQCMVNVQATVLIGISMLLLDRTLISTVIALVIGLLCIVIYQEGKIKGYISKGSAS